MKISSKNLRVAGGCLVVIALLSMFQERLCIKIDAATILTLAIAVFLFTIGDVSNLSKLKFGDVEVEFGEKLEQLETLISTEEVSPSSPTSNIPEGTSLNSADDARYYQSYQAIFNSSSSNLEKVLRASQLLEEMLLEVGKKLNLDEKSTRNASMVVNTLAKLQLLSTQEVSIYREFSSLRNNIIHKDIGLLDDLVTVRILDLILRMIRIFGY